MNNFTFLELSEKEKKE